MVKAFKVIFIFKVSFTWRSCWDLLDLGVFNCSVNVACQKWLGGGHSVCIVSAGDTLPDCCLKWPVSVCTFSLTLVINHVPLPVNFMAEKACLLKAFCYVRDAGSHYKWATESETLADSFFVKVRAGQKVVFFSQHSFQKLHLKSFKPRSKRSETLSSSDSLACWFIKSQQSIAT